jgi:4-oxalocrotonate tautomerase
MTGFVALLGLAQALRRVAIASMWGLKAAVPQSVLIGAELPLVEVTLTEGRTPERLRALVHELHAAVVRAIDAPSESVRVIIREVPTTHWAAGDVTIAERRAKATGEERS